MSSLGKYRVSLKFSEKDAAQTEVVQLLKQMGRRKSQFITKAVMYYLENEPEAEIPMPKATQTINKDALKDVVLELLKEMNISPDASKVLEEKINNASENVQKDIKQNENNDTQTKNVETIEVDEADLDDFLSGLDEF